MIISSPSYLILTFYCQIHTKKRNRLDSERLSSLVYVQFNSKPINKNKKVQDKCDSLLANDSRMAQEWIVEGGDDDESEGSTNTFEETIRELDEDDFDSEEEPEIDDDFMFGVADHNCW